MGLADSMSASRTGRNAYVPKSVRRYSSSPAIFLWGKASTRAFFAP